MVQKERRWSKEMTFYLLENFTLNSDNANLAVKLNKIFNMNFTAEDLNFRFNRLKHEYKNFKKTEGFSKRKKWIYWDYFKKIDEKIDRSMSYTSEEDFRRAANMLNKKFAEIEKLFKNNIQRHG